MIDFLILKKWIFISQPMLVDYTVVAMQYRELLEMQNGEPIRTLCSLKIAMAL